jgi:hypothetical protein
LSIGPPNKMVSIINRGCFSASLDPGFTNRFKCFGNLL